MLTSRLQSAKSQTAFRAERLVMAAMEMTFLCTCSDDFHLGEGGLPATLANSGLIPSSATLPQDKRALGSKQPPVVQPVVTLEKHHRN